MPLTAVNLMDMSAEELDELFRASPAGPIPSGEARGTVILKPDTEFSEVAAKLAHVIFWKGKVFDAERGELRNVIGPLGALAVRAKVFYDESWFDNQQAIILDYSQTSVVAQWIRDEIRLVAPGLYLGIVYWEDKKVLNFSLQFPQ